MTPWIAAGILGSVQSSTAQRGTIVVVHPDRKAQRSLQRLVGATRCRVTVVADIEACLAAVDDQTLVVIDGALAYARPELRHHKAKAWIAVPGDGSAPADAAITAALLQAGWDHVIAHQMPILAEELLATLQKRIRDDVFGLEKYMAWGAELRSYKLDDARDRDAAVAALAKDVVAFGLPDRIGSLVSVIADELLANALYAAPVDANGTRIRAHDARDQSRSLTGRDAVTMRWASDARYLAIEVCDAWGSIELGRVATWLAGSGKASAPRTEESGMGLPLVYACCNQFIVNCKPGKKTEMITLLDVRYKPTEIGRAASFHAFATERS